VFITTQITQITQKVTWLGMLNPLIYFSFNLIPYFLIWVLITFVYVLMPNTKVKLRSGILAGIIAGTIFQLFQEFYIDFQIGMARYNAIYGSFAALPLFLFWVQISWWIVLFGAELSFATQNVRSYEYDPDSRRISPAFKKLLVLQVSHLLIHNFKDGNPPLTASKISKRLSIPIRLLHQVLYELTTAGLLNETKTKRENQFGYQPARDINTLSVGGVLDALDHNGVDDIPVTKTEELEVLSNSLEQFSQAMQNSPANKLLKDI
jgi:membrane protein